MGTSRDLEEKFGITAERIVEIDDDASRGVLQGHAVKTLTGPGRPPLFDEAMQQVAFKERRAVVEAMDRRAAQLGMGRSEYLRQLVENDLHAMGY